MSELKKRKNIKVLKPPQLKPENEADTKSPLSDSSNFWTTMAKVLLFVVAVPPMLNYASLRQEREFLTTNITQYDVGFGQKFFLSCVGEGSPTVILDAPTGMTSDSWTSGGPASLSLCMLSRMTAGYESKYWSLID